MNKTISIILPLLLSSLALFGQGRSEQLISDWEFRLGHDSEAVTGWQTVTVPHDWAIYGPFDRANDLQEVTVWQNGETSASIKTGRTGGLPYMGKGCYRTTLPMSASDLEGGVRKILLFDGAMSEAQVFVNGEKAGFQPYGYGAFHCEVTDLLKEGDNVLTVLLENRPQSARWYPGAGLFRKVRLVTVPEVHVPIWGSYVTTPYVSSDYATVRVRTEVEGVPQGTVLRLRTVIRDASGNEVAVRDDNRKLTLGMPAEQNLVVDNPNLWSPETPYLYTAETSIYHNGALADSYVTRFGIRSMEVRAQKGFFLNGELRKFKGVCLHHDLGPLGAAVNRSAIRHQLELLKEMGCDAIRTSHNMPADELVELCDEMGFMMMVETFDEWDEAKCENGYHRYFDEWAEKDVVSMVRHFRNNPCVVMWSIGNEIPSQWTDHGCEVGAFLQAICHREDPTRPVTCGMDQFDAVVENGFAAQLDIAGFNYKPSRYPEGYAKLPQGLILGSETASTVSSRGVYHLPVTVGPDITADDHHSSSYDTEYCSWSNIPELDFAADEDFEWVMGQFLWTGVDYLGEPSPFDTDAWPNHSSMFGAIDLAGIPKDRFWLYRSIWNEDAATLHVLPHWNWAGHEGQTVPVFVYTSYPEAELFVNGVSQGRRSKVAAEDAFLPDILARTSDKAEIGRALMGRYRLMWNDVTYSPGELKVVAYDADGNVAEEKVVRTAGKPYALKLSVCSPLPTEAQAKVAACKDELVYLNVSAVDRNGNPVPTDGSLVKIKVKGNGSFRAAANGDPTCLDLFHLPAMHLFSGQMTAIVQSDGTPGTITVEATSKGLKKAVLSLECVTPGAGLSSY